LRVERPRRARPIPRTNTLSPSRARNISQIAIQGNCAPRPLAPWSSPRGHQAVPWSVFPHQQGDWSPMPKAYRWSIATAISPTISYARFSTSTRPRQTPSLYAARRRKGLVGFRDSMEWGRNHGSAFNPAKSRAGILGDVLCNFYFRRRHSSMRDALPAPDF